MALRVDGTETDQRRWPWPRFVAACVPAVGAATVAIILAWQGLGAGASSHRQVLLLWAAYALVAGVVSVLVSVRSLRVWQSACLLIPAIAAGYWLAIDLALRLPPGRTDSGPPTPHPSESWAQTLQYVGLGMLVLFALVVLAFVVCLRGEAPDLGFFVLSLAALVGGFVVAVFDERELVAMFTGRPHWASLAMGHLILAGLLVVMSQVLAVIGLCLGVMRRRIVGSIACGVLMLPSLLLVVFWVMTSTSSL